MEEGTDVKIFLLKFKAYYVSIKSDYDADVTEGTAVGNSKE